MRISDWSSDVCSSDLGTRRSVLHRAGSPQAPSGTGCRHRTARPGIRRRYGSEASRALVGPLSAGCRRDAKARRVAHQVRSEEHTSELQSLMRNSYAVFCLKKKTRIHHTIIAKVHESIIDHIHVSEVQQ